MGTEQYGRGLASSEAPSTFCSSQSALFAAEAKARLPRNPPVRSRFAARLSRAKVSGSNPSVCTSGIPVRAGVRGVGGVSSMRTGAIEEPVIGAVSVAAAVDVVSAAVDVVAAAVDGVSSCRIVANARVLSASGMVCEYQTPSGLKSGSRSGGCVQEVKLTMASLSVVPWSGTKSRTKTLFFKTALPM
ncbi:unnamed protein product [Closterium sp. NIES-53]